jgi:hypothetical protein
VRDSLRYLVYVSLILLLTIIRSSVEHLPASEASHLLRRVAC